MAIQLQCPQCQCMLKVRDEMAGRKGKCPKCNTVMAIPDIAGAAAPADSASLGVAEWYYLDAQGQQQGPVTRQRMGELTRAGGIYATSVVWREGMAEWRPLGETELAGLVSVSPPPPPQAAPQPPPRPAPQPRANRLEELSQADNEEEEAASGGQRRPREIAEQTYDKVKEARASHGLDTAPRPAHREFAGQQGFHKQRLGILIAASGGMLATFLPWVHAPIIGAISGARGDGWLTLLLFVPALVLSLVGDRSTPLIAGRRLGAVIPAALATLIGVWKIVDFNRTMGDVPKDNPFAEALSLSVQIGVGLYLLIAAGVALGVLAWFLESRRPGMRRKHEMKGFHA